MSNVEYRLVIKQYAREWEIKHPHCGQREIALDPPRDEDAGGQGSICFGTLADGSRVAVKMGSGLMDDAGAPDGAHSGEGMTASDKLRSDEALLYRQEFAMLRRAAHTQYAPLPLGYGWVDEGIRNKRGEFVRNFRHVAIAEERIAGKTLSWVIDHQAKDDGAPLALGDIAEICRCVATMLCELDRCNIAHRDCKPQNIMVMRPDPEGPWIAKLVDFGLATLQDAGITQAAVALASIPYASPEKIDRFGAYAGAEQGKNRGDKSIEIDVYGLSQIALCMRVVPEVFKDEATFRKAAIGAGGLDDKAMRDEYCASRATLAKLSGHLSRRSYRPGDRALEAIIDLGSRFNPEDRPSPYAMLNAFARLQAWCDAPESQRESEDALVAHLFGAGAESGERPGAAMGDAAGGQCASDSTGHAQRQDAAGTGAAQRGTASAATGAAASAERADRHAGSSPAGKPLKTSLDLMLERLREKTPSDIGFRGGAPAAAARLTSSMPAAATPAAEKPAAATSATAPTAAKPAASKSAAATPAATKPAAAKPATAKPASTGRVSSGLTAAPVSAAAPAAKQDSSESTARPAARDAGRAPSAAQPVATWRGDPVLLRKVSETGICDRLVHAILAPFLDAYEGHTKVGYYLDAPDGKDGYYSRSYHPSLRFLAYAWAPRIPAGGDHAVDASTGTATRYDWYAAVSDEAPSAEDLQNTLRSLAARLPAGERQVRCTIVCPRARRPYDPDRWKRTDELRARFEQVEIIETDDGDLRRDLALMLFADSNLVVPGRRPLSREWLGRFARVATVKWPVEGVASIGIQRHAPIDIDRALKDVPSDEPERRARRRARLLATRIYSLPILAKPEFSVIRELFFAAQETKPNRFTLDSETVERSLERFGGARQLLSELDRPSRVGI